MRKIGLWVLVLSFLLPGLAHSLEVKNVRLTHGAWGATRLEDKFMPGDYLFMMYDLEGITVDEKTGKASYLIVMEVIDSQGKTIFKQESPNEVVPMLGGNRLPGKLDVIMGRQQAPGKYWVRLNITDRISKENKVFHKIFHLVEPGFGFIGVVAPAIGVPGQHYLVQMALVDMTLDGKNQPNVDISMRILDETGTTPVAKPILTSFPKDLPEDADLKKNNFQPLQVPVYLNRPGRFIIEVDAVDKNGNKQSKLRIPLTVLDLTTIGGR